MLAVTGGKGETPIMNKFHNYSDHVSVWEQTKQFAGEATVPDRVIGGS